jgi:hypothetical protein
MNSEILLWIVVILGIIWKVVEHVRYARSKNKPMVPQNEPIPPTLAPPSTHIRSYAREPAWTPVTPRREQGHSVAALPKTNQYGELED